MKRSLGLFLFAMALLLLAPDRQLGPYGALNPQSLARLIAVLMALMVAAELAQRALGPRLGLAVTGFAGGFVSSSATIAMLGNWSREHPGSYRSAVAGALASNIATVVQYAVIVAAVDPALLRVLAGSLGCATVMALALASAAIWLRSVESALPVGLGMGFGLLNALGFALVFALVSIGAAALHEVIGEAGIVMVSMVAALVDAHSTAGSLASLHRAGDLDAQTAELAILLALSANSLTKMVMAFSGRHLKFGFSVSVGVLLVTGAAWLGRFML